ncbi:pyridoxal phosphate-dependent transferase [Lipomyces kononenkoae]|uniref:Pyridoxal phosphate-dependent transferase n=1 Tax=Lipomyces kononenkoae TaxID=34357 RepID=A0ACC3TA28_LIPKO
MTQMPPIVGSSVIQVAGAAASLAMLTATHSHIVWCKVISSTSFRTASTAVFLVITARLATKSLRELRARGIIGTVKDLYKFCARNFFRFMMTLPGIKEKVNAELDKTLARMEEEMVPRGPGITRHLELPKQGWTDDLVVSELHELAQMKHSLWEAGRVSGGVYHGGEDMLKLQTEAYGMFSVANQLHPDIFPGVRKMEAEVVSMVLRMYNAPESGVGASTSGGTESLLMACLAAKMKGWHEKGIIEPEIVAPVTIHAGFDKAAYYFGIKLRHAPLDPVTYKVDLKAVRRLINSNTVLIAGSAPNFPHGIIDDIEGLSEIAVKHNIPLHVDACLGSFVIPFMEKVYSEIDSTVTVPLFDFRVKGVTSISCDTHKYGFAPKGSSVIMYRDAKLRRYQYFLATDWSGGVYASPTLAGSRPGALMAGCWATLMRIGENGYVESCRNIVSAARSIRLAIQNEFECLYVLGQPIGSVVAFSSETLNIYDIADGLLKKGWHLSALQNPAAIHIACTRLTITAVAELISDLREVVAQVETHIVAGEKKQQGDTAMLYGVAGSISTHGIVDELAVGFLDTLYKV